MSKKITLSTLSTFLHFLNVAILMGSFYSSIIGIGSGLIIGLVVFTPPRDPSLQYLETMWSLATCTWQEPMVGYEAASLSMSQLASLTLNPLINILFVPAKKGVTLTYGYPYMLV